MWRDFENVCQKQAKQILGVSKGGTPIKKDTSWWSDEVKLIIKAKRDAFHKWQRSEMEKDRLEYKSMKSLAKTTVAQARAISRQDFYDKLENAPNENTIFKIAKQRHRSTLDTKFNKYIKDQHGKLLTSNDAINERWKEYYNQLLNEEFPSEEHFSLSCTEGPLERIDLTEVKQALKKMDFHKAVGPDNVPVDVWA
ncbi:uncharacterized protein LOC125234208 [Leguminivora glycinivorella]|uniref:uncharacterized protein LOC125234208 n=1 Tax=Leguminivora glycinivorella TaxID=1035111 RepID=UPI00200BAA09|nr:uncharacterized protein LOC125234208 [Leguminivora glycinivorella]